MVGLDDVGVDQVGHQLGFADEVLDELLLVGVVLADDLDGDALDEVAGAVLLGFVDDAHAAFEDLAHDLVAELVLDGEEGHARMLVKRAESSQACAVSQAAREWEPRFFLRNLSFSPCTTRAKGFNSRQVERL